MDKNNKIDKQIKESFVSLNKQVPSKVWNNLSMQLDADFDLERKIKESFESKINYAPEGVWNKINRQLNIDNSWNIIKTKLNRQTYFSFFKVVAVIIILLMISSLERSSNSHYKLISYHPQSFNNKNKHKNDHFNLSGTRNKPSGEEKTQLVPKNNFAKHIAKENRIKDVNQTNTNKFQSNLSDNIQQKDIPHESIKGNFSNENIIIDKLPSIKPIISVSNHNVNIDKPIQDILFQEDYYFNETNTNIRYEVGLTYSLQNTWILNNETRKSFDSNSLIRSQSSFTNNFGFLFSYYLNENNVITTDLYVLGETKQKYGTYYEGRYYQQSINLTFTQLAVLYQYNINKIHKIPTSFSIKAGMYFSVFTKKQIILDNYNRDNTNDFSQYDYGLKFAIGHKNRIQRLTIEYGINSKYGIKNIFNGNNLEPSSFDKTHLLHFGSYINFSYNF